MTPLGTDWSVIQSECHIKQVIVISGVILTREPWLELGQGRECSLIPTTFSYRCEKWKHHVFLFIHSISHFLQICVPGECVDSELLHVGIGTYSCETCLEFCNKIEARNKFKCKLRLFEQSFSSTPTGRKVVLFCYLQLLLLLGRLRLTWQHLYYSRLWMLQRGDVFE